MKKLVIALLALLSFTACQQDALEELDVQTRSTNYVSYGFNITEWPRLSYDIGGELIDIRYVNAESSSVDAGYTLHSTGTMVMEVTISNGRSETILNPNDFYLTDNIRSYPYVYHKRVSLYTSNSPQGYVSTLTLEPNETRTIYIYTNELFRYATDGWCSYGPLTPPFTITLWYKDNSILQDDVDAYCDTRSYWERYR